VRRAEAQVRALFNRSQVDVFLHLVRSPQSFFAHTVSASEKNPASMWRGGAGTRVKVVFLRACLAMLSAAKKHYDAAGGTANATNPADRI